jgi:segregation and condensation protein B
MDPQLLKRVIEAILLAAAQPLSLAQLAALFTEEENVDNDQLLAALGALAEDCEQRGIELKEVASGYRYQIREDVHSWVTRLWTERQTKYSRALLETLALIAYRQPITRAEIEQIRGVAVSSSIIKTLEEREWIRVVGYRDVPGRPALFGTSRIFLDYFNLKSLDELPPLAEIRDLDDYEPQLDLAPVIPPSLELPPDDDDESPTVAQAATEAHETAEAANGTEAPQAANDAATPEADADMNSTHASDEAAAGTTGSEVADPVSDADVIAVDDDEAAEEIAGEDFDAEGADRWPDLDAADADIRDRDADTASGDASTDPEISPDDGDVGPNDTTTSDDVPEHTA